jgi:ZIP family zinc transporter
MAEAFWWGLLGASSLLIGAFAALGLKIKKRVLGLIMAFGVGVLISAVAYELVEEAFSAYSNLADGWPVAAGLAAGALVFFVGDTLVDRFGGEHRKGSETGKGEGSGLAILLGTILDGIPESMVIGLTILSGGVVSAAMVAAVFLSNLPEAIGASAGLKASGWKTGRILGLWVVVVVISALSALLGYVLFDTASPGTVAFTLSFAGGALLTMLADTMMPEAYKDSGKLVGLVTTLGFGLAFAISILD